MKTVTLLLVTLVVGTFGYLIKVPTETTRPKLGYVGLVHQQKLILQLFENVCEVSDNPIIVRLSEEFAADPSSGVYLNPDEKGNYDDFKIEGVLPKGEIFTDFNIDHINVLKTIYEFLIDAKDFDTFYKAAAWARQNVNCGLFVRAIYLAILNRRDTEKLSVPAPYELLPNYFIQKDVIFQASALLTGEEVVLNDNIRDEGNSYVLNANYSAEFIENDDKYMLSYFHEDIGLNTFYFLQRLKASPSFNTHPNKRYGEYLYHTMRQLASRYNLERYANGLLDVETINLDDLAASPYDPMLTYSNGNEFGHRTTSVSADDVDILHTIEKSISTVVTYLRDNAYNKPQILNHLMDVLVIGERSYETLLRASIGKDDTFVKRQPSVLDHYLTSLRDPMFWKINNKIVDLVDDVLKGMPAYTRDELYFPGIEVQNIEIKKITTNFDYFEFDVTDALKTGTNNTAFQIKIGQLRLNHKPFAVKLNISSLVAQKGLVKIYLGPKVAPGTLTVNKRSFMLLDSFEYNFKTGSNIVSRTSEQMTNLSEDFASLRTIRKNVEDAEFGLNALPFKDVESILGFPQRLILPKGTPEGLPLQIFVFVAPFVKSTYSEIYTISDVEFNSAILSPGYPLDLDVHDTQLFNLPNTMVKDILITHKGGKVFNFGGAEATKKGSKESYEPSSQTDYTASKKEPFDYTAKKAQYGREQSTYGKKGEYATKTEYDKGKNITEKIDDVNTPSNPEDTKTKDEYLEKSKFDDKIINNYPKELEPIKDVDYIQNNDADDKVYSYSPRIYTRIPTVYDYIVSPEAYNDDIDINRRIYE